MLEKSDFAESNDIIIKICVSCFGWIHDGFIPLQTSSKLLGIVQVGAFKDVFDHSTGDAYPIH